MEELMNKLLNGIVNYFYDLLKQNKKKFKKFKGDVNNPYYVSDWLLNLSEKVNYDEKYDIENNISEILKFIGYGDDLKVIKEMKAEYNYDEQEDDTITKICSYRRITFKNGISVDSELTFTELGGVNFEPMEFIPFMYKTMVLYEYDKIFDKYE